MLKTTNWNELHDRVDAILDAMDDLPAVTDCEGLLHTQLAEHLAQARNICRALAADAATRNGGEEVSNDPVLYQVAAALAAKGYDATYEYPNYVGITMPNGRVACFGDANVDYTANWEECRPDEGIEFFLPQTATVPELITAIEAWIKAQGTNAA